MLPPRPNAAGLWQFIQGTAEGYGLEVNNILLTKEDILLNLPVGSLQIFTDDKEFGNWTLVAAAYNRGQRGMKDTRYLTEDE